MHIQHFLRLALVLAVLVAAPTAIAAGSVLPGVQVPPGEFNQAIAALAALTTWRDQPPMYVDLCDPLDPAGTPARKSLVDTWRAEHAADFDRITGYENRLAPVMFRIEGIVSADPGRQLREETQVHLRDHLRAKTHDQMLKTCTGFAGLTMFNESVIAPIRSKAFLILAHWATGQGAQR